MLSSLPIFARCVRVLAGVCACSLALSASEPTPAAGAAAPRPPLSQPLITRVGELWRMGQAERGLPHPFRLELVVHYYDPHWKLMWGWDGADDLFVPLENVTTHLRNGQRVRIEGTMVPERGVPLAEATITVLAEDAQIAPLDARGRIGDADRLNPRMVVVEGYVNRQAEIDPDHLLLELDIEGQPVSARVLIDHNQPLPQVQGATVRLTGLYVATSDSASPLSKVDIWVPSPDRIELLEWLENDQRFRRPAIPIEAVPDEGGELVRVTGVVRSQVPGAAVVIRDYTGQVTVKTAMTRLIEAGVSVEAVGYPATEAGDRVLRQGLYRPTRRAEGGPPVVRGLPLLRLIDQVRALPVPEADLGYEVRLSGIVTWSHPQAPFFFLRDASGGIGVDVPPGTSARPAIGSRVNLEGVSAAGEFAPKVVARLVTAGDFAQLPEPRPVTLEHAMTGVEEGEWVSLSGFVRSARQERDWVRLELTTSAGEFSALLPATNRTAALAGSVVRLRGVCTAEVNAERQLISVRLLVGQEADVTIEERMPEDLFRVPIRTIASLRQFNTLEAVNHRVRVAGVVLNQQPGVFLDLQDGTQGLRVLSRTTGSDPLVPGDRVEAVGFAGRQGNRLVLREAVWRRLRHEGEPEPVRLGRVEGLNPEFDGRLVTVEAALVETGVHSIGQRLFCQSGDVVFEALLNAGSPIPPDWRRGSRLALTGVYQVQPDAYGRPHTLQLLLRSERDVQVLRKAPWWTVERALGATGVLGVAILLGLVWVNALQHRVSRQTAEIREQIEKAARLEAELVRSSKLESLGVLAGGIAHDFNNLLTVVMGNLSLVLTDDRLDDESKQFLREGERAALRARDLTQQLLTFSKGGAPVRAAVRLPDVIREAAGFAQHGSNVRCHFAFAPNVWPADADKGQVAQVVHNIVINAIQAMPNGGLVHLTLENEAIHEGAVAALPAGRYVKLTIADGGSGITPEHMARIFDPYFTTKERGSGLGLATVYSIVKKHRGHIEVNSTVGQGTVFRIWLPAADAIPDEAVSVPAGLPRWTGRVLVMDDEPPIRAFMEAVLRRIGFEVTAVGDGEAAMREFAAARDIGRPFTLVILDLTIPGGMGGAEAVQNLRLLDPHVRAIVSSGYSKDPVVANHRAYGFCGMVPKPYVVADVIRTIGEVMQASARH